MITKRRKPGFTLVELIITVAILFMMVAVATPLFASIIAQRRLTAAVERVAADLRYAQSRAVTRGDWHRLHSGADGTVGRPGQYRLERSVDGVVWVPMEESFWYNLSTDYRGSSLQSVTDFANTPVPGFDVRFNSRGAIDNVGVGSAGIRLTVVAETGATGTIHVMRTGAVRIQ
jgi:type II secretory pathway pseudopilin PulG